MNYTDNYNLRKPEPTDPVDIQDLNYNADAIDGKLKEIEDWETAHLQATNPHSITPALIGAETPAGAQVKANTAETNAKAYTDAHEQKAAPHSGHETPAGAQQKANQAETNAKSYADTVANNTLNSAKDYADEKANQAETNAKSYTDEEIVEHKAENMPHQFINHKENKTYKFGFQVSVDGKPQIIYEEVV